MHGSSQSARSAVDSEQAKEPAQARHGHDQDPHAARSGADSAEDTELASAATCKPAVSQIWLDLGDGLHGRDQVYELGGAGLELVLHGGGETWFKSVNL